MKSQNPNGNKKLIINLFLIFLIFGFSVIVRLDNLKTPLGRHHEWITGHVLSTIEIFNEKSASAYYFSPVNNFNTIAERHVISGQKFKDKNNFSYYVSYPPLCFLLPYTVFKLFHIENGVTAIRSFSLFNHFLCALLILLIINRFFEKKLSKDIFLPGLVGYSLYVFAAGNLWFHGNVYFADMLVQLFVLAFLYVFLGLIESPEKINFKSLLIIAALTFLGVYTEWLAIFVAFFSAVLLFFLGFKNKRFFLLLTIISASTLLSLSITIFQYSRISGFDKLKEVWIEKYAQRSGQGKGKVEQEINMYNKSSYTSINKNYFQNYKDLIHFAEFALVLFAFVIIYFLFYNKTGFKKSHFILFGILILSILAHHLVFFNFTVVHDFSTLKSSIFFSLFIAFTFAHILEISKSLSKQFFMATSIILILGLFSFVHFSIQNYYKRNQLSTVVVYHKLVGDAVRKYSKPDEIIFMREVGAETVFYCRRKIVGAQDVAESRRFLKWSQYPKGLFIDIDNLNSHTINRVIRINSNGDSLIVKTGITYDEN